MVDASSETPTQVRFSLEGPRPQRRLTIFFRFFPLIPHFVWIALVGIVVYFALIIGWLCALVTGRLPQAFAEFVARYLRYVTRVGAYATLMHDRFPSFALDQSDVESGPVWVGVPEGMRLNRAAVLFRLVLMVPAWIAVTVVGGGLSAALPVIWLITIVRGRMGDSTYAAEAAVLRYQARFYAFAMMLTSEYPRGLFGEQAPGHRGTETDTETVDDAPAGPPRITRLVLSTTARRLIILFIVLGVLTNVGSVAAAAANVAEARRAGEELDKSHDDLLVATDEFSRTSQTCAASDGLPCLQQAQQELADAFGRFQADLRQIDFPDSAQAAASRLDDDCTEIVQQLAGLRAATDAVTLDARLRSLQDALDRFDADYAGLASQLFVS